MSEDIREIRASEARVYQRIREIFALAVDYREGEREPQLFFATMQNKMHYAATGSTAAEIIRRRADAGESNMGLTAWKGGRVLKGDEGTAKNYLDARPLSQGTLSLGGCSFCRGRRLLCPQWVRGKRLLRARLFREGAPRRVCVA